MPNRADLGVDKVLQRFMSIYRNSPDSQPWIANRLLPVMPVSAKTGTFYRISESGFGYAATTNGLKRASGAPYKRLSFNVEQISAYVLEDFGVEAAVDDVDEAFAREDGVMLREAAAEIAGDTLFIERERSASTLLFTAATWGVNTAALGAADRWDVATGDPRKTIDLYANTIRKARGIPQRMLSLAIGKEVADDLSTNEFITDLVKQTEGFARAGTRLSMEQIANALRIKEVIVGEAVANTVEEGLTPVNDDIWGGDAALLMHIVPNPRPKRSHGIGGTFRHKSIPAGGRVVRYRENNPPAEFVRANYIEQQVVTDQLSGFFITTVIN